MDTLIGVFTSRERAQQTVKELLDQRVPQDAVVFMPGPAPDEKSSEQLAYSGEESGERPSFIVVRTDQPEIVKTAAEILDRMGISAQWRTSGRMKTAARQTGDISVVDVQGVITLGEGNIMLREVVSGLLAKGHKRILLNLRGVEYVDSSGLGELIKTHTTLQRQGGQLKIVNLNQKVQQLFQATSLFKVFDVYKDEESAILSFGQLAKGA
jgi:anti-sigma B factor antagonist